MPSAKQKKNASGDGGIVNNAVGRMWQEAVIPWCFPEFSGMVWRRTIKNLRHNNLCHGRDSKRVPPKYNLEANLLLSYNNVSI